MCVLDLKISEIFDYNRGVNKKMGSDYESKIGILTLVDIANLTEQANQLGDIKLKGFSEKIERQIRDIAGEMGLHFIKSIGDAFLLFFEAADSPTMCKFLDFVSQLRHKSIDGCFDFDDFVADLRCVAHFGNFQFKMEGEDIVDLQSAEGIKVFRMEKEADKYEVIITEHLYNLVKNILDEQNIDSIQSGEKALKGFWDRPTLLYKLIFPEKEMISELLSKKMTELETACRAIPIFGGVFPAISMEENFINLSTKGVIKDHYLDIDTKQKIMEDLEAKDRSEKYESMKQHYSTVLTARELYEKYNQGVIFGLPGSGKTTMLHYFAHRDLAENQRVVLFYHCRTAYPYSQWLKSARDKSEPDFEDIESMLAYFTHHFLFGKKLKLSLKEKKELFKAEMEVVNAYNRERLTLLMDGLDECQSQGMKESAVTLYRRLSKKFSRSENKLYLTARYSEKGDFFDEGEGYLFEVCSLDMEQLREMARHFYGKERSLYQTFDKAVWKEEVAARVGGTPVTAILLLAYFKRFQRLDSRYLMYDVLMKFILLNIWERLKESNFNTGVVGTFFDQARSREAFNHNKEMGDLYDALTLLAYDYIQVEETTMTHSSILDTFSLAAVDSQQGQQWFERLIKEHLLLYVGRSESDEEYVFIHSTVMEFLAARHIVKRLENKEPKLAESLKQVGQRLFEMETLPIASGSSLDHGFMIQRLLRQFIQSPLAETTRQAVYVCGYRSLTEIERHIGREFEKARTPRLIQQKKEKIKKNRAELVWIYKYLKELMLTQEEDRLKLALDQFKNISRLSLPDFLENYLTYTAYLEGGVSAQSPRGELLSTIMNKRVLEEWLQQKERQAIEKSLKKEEKQLEEAGGSLLRFDSLHYNPEDKNFNYYKKNIGNSLVGFLGSPNFRHSGVITCMAALPDGQRLISGSDDRTLKLWELATGKEGQTFKGHTDSVTCVTVTPDGEYVVSGSADTTLKLWKLADGKEIRTLKGHDSSVTGATVTPDGQHIVSGSDDQTLILWNLADGTAIRSFRGHAHNVNCTAVTPDGKHVASGSSDRTLKLWSLSTGKEVRVFEGHTDYVTCLEITPDGRHMVSGSSDQTLKLWDLSTGKTIRSYRGHDSPVTAVSITFDGKYVASGSCDHTLKLWDLLSGQEIRTFGGHTDHIIYILITHDNKHIISGSSDRSLKVWEIATGKERQNFVGHASYVNCVAGTPDGRHIISGSDDHTLKVWTSGTGQEMRTLKGHTDTVNCAQVAPNGKLVISGSADTTLKVWDFATGKEIRTLRGHTDRVKCLAFTPDCQQAVSGADDHTLKLWRLSKNDNNDKEVGKEILTLRGHHSSVNGAAVTAGGEYAISASSDKTLKLWGLANGEEIRTFKGHADYVNCLALTLDEKHIVSASNDQTLKLWSLSAGKEIRSFQGHTDDVNCVTITPDGRHMISGAYDMTLKIWNIQTGDCLQTVELPWVPLDIKPVPGTQWFATANRSGTLTLFDFTMILNKN
jgi:WD40 repeat protein/class 3 adenylate cyclase/GTPase SAR1 family protein